MIYTVFNNQLSISHMQYVRTASENVIDIQPVATAQGSDILHTQRVKRLVPDKVFQLLNRI